MNYPRVIISGTHSGSGKTVISLAIMRILYDLGYKVQPFKVGPDFIDPSYHYFACYTRSRNLDSFILSKKDIIRNFIKGMKGKDIGIIEGTMGLYDSCGAISEKGSTAEVSKILKSPILLIVDAKKLGRTAAAIVLGYLKFDRDINIRACIINKVGNERHAMKVKTAIKYYTGLNIIGIIPRDEKLFISERHLGLIPAYERDKIEEFITNAAEFVKKNIDVEKIIDLAYSADSLCYDDIDDESNNIKKDINVGIFFDKAFNFYYTENLEELSKYANLKYINSIKDNNLKDIDCLYIGGGFPEVFAKELERNKSLRNEVFEFCRSGKPVYAECGGLMYLGESILINKDEYDMVGFFEYKTVMEKKFQALGYVVIKSLRDNILLNKGEILKGHEFHYSRPIFKDLTKYKFAFKVLRGKGFYKNFDGIMYKNVLANYVHFHAYSKENFFKKFVEIARYIKYGGENRWHFQH